MDALFVAAINHVLRRNSWAQAQLAAHAGKSVRFECAPASLALIVLDHGEVAPAHGAQAEVTIRITPGTALRLLARDAAVWRDIEVSGDTDFAAAIDHVWRNLRFDVEEDLARVFGDIAAHRMTQTGRALDRWRAQSFDSIARSFAEYWTEEEPLIARAHDVDRFNRDVDLLRDDVARIEKRIAQLAARRETQPV